MYQGAVSGSWQNTDKNTNWLRFGTKHMTAGILL